MNKDHLAVAESGDCPENGEHYPFSKGQRVQYKDMRAASDCPPKSLGLKMAGLVGVVLTGKLLAGKPCALHGRRACDLLSVRFPEYPNGVRCHPEHLIPLDSTEVK